MAILDMGPGAASSVLLSLDPLPLRVQFLLHLQIVNKLVVMLIFALQPDRQESAASALQVEVAHDCHAIHVLTNIPSAC